MWSSLATRDPTIQAGENVTCRHRPACCATRVNLVAGIDKVQSLTFSFNLSVAQQDLVSKAEF